MKKTIAVIGSAAALSFSGAGLAAAQSEFPLPELPGMGSSAPADEAPVEDAPADDAPADETGDDATPEAPAEVSGLAAQVCGTVATVDVLGSVGGIAPGLEGDDCGETVDEAVAAAQSGDVMGAVDLLRGVQIDAPEGEGEVDEAAATVEGA